MRITVPIALIAACLSFPAVASGLESLESFVKTVKSGRASFVQTATSPAKAGQAARVKTSSGTFEFIRPNRFRFVYQKPFEQSIVADGQTVWLFDVDLNQVTARKQAQVMGSTPIALIASAPDVRALQAEFLIAEIPSSDKSNEGLQWVVATPRSKDNALRSVRIGFKGNALAVLEMEDSFGQQSVLRFSGFEVNAGVDAALFAFKPPAGADVIRQ
jgi:outer membrane lipoprotein carrier protein